MTFTVLTLGCKVNQSESLAIERELLERGHSRVELGESPDICIVNTCTVTARSDYQSRQMIRRAMKENSKVYVTGCYSTLHPSDIKEISEGIQIIPNDTKAYFFSSQFGVGSSVNSALASRNRFFAKIQDGCDNSCTYCAVHLARGKSRSFEPNQIVESINEAHRLGLNEAVLTGVHIGKYGHDLTPRIDLASLIQKILIHTGIPRIRVSSLEVNELGDDIIELLAEERICKHIHVPLQSGDNRILRRMNRLYSVEEFKKTIDDVLTHHADIAIGTDVIAGFPGEDSSSFETTIAFTSNAGFSYLHAFPFSRRKNTPAATFKGQIPSAVIKERVQRLRLTSVRLKRLYMSRFIGKPLEAIIEKISSAGQGTATTGNYLKMRIHSPLLREGSLVKCQVEDVRDDHIVGSLCQHI